MIGELLATACQRFRARSALVRGNETPTYGELLERGARLAKSLATIGADRPPGVWDSRS
jgi:non-ribosomal peptide synthetase component F